MRILRQTGLPLAASLLSLAFCLAGTAHASHTHRAGRRAHHASLHHATYSHASRRRGRHNVHRHAVSLGQRVMDPQRASEIQQALIQAHYLGGSPTGQWDADSQAAMEKFQADNGWQTKITPDSRALIKLGLGPRQDDGEYSASTPAAPVSGGTPVSQLTRPTPAAPIRTLALNTGQ